MLFAVGCSGSSTGSQVSSSGTLETVKIGVLTPVTGASPINGASQKAAIELAVEDVNTYLAGIESKIRVEAVIEDTKGSIDEENRLIGVMHEREIPIVVGSLTSESLSLLKGQIDAHGTIILNEVSTSPYLSYDDNLFRLVPDDRHTAAVMADLLWEKGIEKIIFYYRDDWWGTALKEGLTAAFTSNGGGVAGSIAYGSRTYTADMDEKVEQLKTCVTEVLQVTAPGKAAVILLGFEEGIEILKKSSAYPVLATLKWYTGDGLGQNGALLKDATAAAFAAQVGLYAPLIAEVDSQVYRDLQARIQGKTGLAPYAFSPVIYDAFWLASLTRVEGGTAAQLKATLLAKAQTYAAVSSADSKINFNSSGDRSNCSFDFWRVVSVGSGYQWIKDVATYSATSATLKRLAASKFKATGRNPSATTVQTVAQRYSSPAVLPEPTFAEFMMRLTQEQKEQKR